ncbi:MAG: hypothetical protein EZS28_005131 [Streblomastix strix]|uniref:Uncharacterized protein n=1 Tax=Streblomastix strix TaxID=222440 RepID=A0A5J4WYD6_9EUKA|nr:MAG: hypothetical protein EZS28_005131 [Streblomastix strix]
MVRVQFEPISTKDAVQRKSNFTSKRPSSRDSYQTPNYANLVPQNQLQTAAQPQSTFANAFRQNLEIDPLDPDQTIATPDEVPSDAITAVLVFLAGLPGQQTWQIDFYAEMSSEEIAVEARKRARAATDLLTRRKPPKHNNPTAQPMLAFDQCSHRSGNEIAAIVQTVIENTDLDSKTRLESDSKVNMMRALMDTTEQGNLLKTQLSPVIRPGYKNQMRRSLRALPQTERAHMAPEDVQLTRIVSFTGELEQELKKLTVQQFIDKNRCKPEIIPPEWAQDLARKQTPQTQLTAFLSLLSQLQQQSLNLFSLFNPFYNHLTQQQIQGQQQPQYPFQQSRKPMQYSIQPVQFPIMPPQNPFLPTVNLPQTQISEPRLPNKETERDQQGSGQSSQQIEKAAKQTVERPRQSTTSARSVQNLLIPPISAYPLLQTSRIPLLPYTTERNQQQ